MISEAENLSVEALLEIIRKQDILLKDNLAIGKEQNRIITELHSQNQLLKYELAQLKRMIFGSKSERFAPAEIPGQLSLGMESEPTQEAAPETTVTVEAHDRRKKGKEKKQPVRAPFPESLHRETTVIVQEGDLTDFVEIGQEVKEELEITESKMFVKRTVRIKYARKNGEGVIIAPLPPCVIEKGLFGPNLIAQILIDKYVDHLPIYRQLKRFEREGVKLAYSTLLDVPRQVSPLMLPLYDLIVKEVMSSGYIQADETPHPVLDEETKGKTHRGYFWVYRSPEKKLVLFDYRPGRGREGPAQMLKNYNGFLQTDGYAVYDDFEKRQGITLVGCMAHARRYFDKALDSDPDRATFAIKKILLLYETEKTIRDQQESPDEIIKLRKENSFPVLLELSNWMKEQLVLVAPQSPLGKALAYSLARWEKLTRYIHHAELEIDNNLVENEIRPTVLGRKNYLFAGSHEAAQRSAIIYTFLGCCKINGINPQKWLADVLLRIADTKMTELYTLLPDNWQPKA